MSNTEWHYLSGKSKWARVYKPDEEYDNTYVVVYLDDESWEKFDKLGLGLQPKTDDEGRHVKFRRPMTKMIKGEAVEFGLPKVVDKEGKETNVLIGNGSTVTVKICVFDTRKGKGHRLEAVRIDELVEYAGKGDGAQEVFPF